MPTKSQGTTLSWGGTPVGQVISVTPGGAPSKLIDITDFSDTIVMQRAGRRQVGDFTFDIIFNQDNSTHSGLRTDWYAGTSKTVILTFPTGTINDYTFTGRIMNFTLSAEEDGVWKGQLKLQKVSIPVRS